MQNSGRSGKKPIEEMEAVRLRKAKLEHVSRDAAKHSKTEEVLLRPKELYRAVMENTYIPIALIDVNHKILMVNSAASRILRKPACELIGRECFKEFEKRESICSHCPGKRAMATSQLAEAETEGVRDDGSHFSVRIQAFPTVGPDGTVTGFIELIEDITERKKAEEALRDSEEKYRNIFENAREVIITLDLKGNITNINKMVEEYGFKREELIGKNHFDFIPDQYRAQAFKDFENLFRGVVDEGEIELCTPRGNIIVEYKQNPIKSGEEIVGIQIITTDITERKQAEEELRRSRDYLKVLTDSMWDAVFSVKMPGRVIEWVNDSFRLTGYEPEDCIGRTTEFLYPNKEEFLDFGSKLKRAISEGKDVLHAEQVLRRKNGEIFPSEITTTLSKEKGKVIRVTSIVRDITKRKKAEEKLLDYQSQLKSSASELTLAEERERRRIATELHATISQSLASSKIELDALRHSVSPRDPGQALKEVSDSLGRAINNMRALTFDLSFPILYELGFEAAVAAWLADRIEEKHGITTEFEDDELPKLLDDDVRVFLFRDVRELLINVVKHAQAKKVKVSIRKVGSEMHVSVEDDGWGFDPKKVATTAVRKGGFGLFSIRERLEQLGGHLEIESAPGCGTKATLIAPLKQEKVDKREKR